MFPNNILLKRLDWPLRWRAAVGPGQARAVPQAFQFGIDEMLREIDAIANNPEPPTFANTIEAMEKAGERLDRVQSLFGGDDRQYVDAGQCQALDKEWSPKLSAAYDKINLNAKLFARISKLYDRANSLGLDAKQMRLLTRTYEGFVRRGAKLERCAEGAVVRLQPAACVGAFPSSTRGCWPTRRPSPRRAKPRWPVSSRT